MVFFCFGLPLYSRKHDFRRYLQLFFKQIDDLILMTGFFRKTFAHFSGDSKKWAFGFTKPLFNLFILLHNIIKKTLLPRHPYFRLWLFALLLLREQEVRSLADFLHLISKIIILSIDPPYLLFLSEHFRYNFMFFEVIDFPYIGPHIFDYFIFVVDGLDTTQSLLVKLVIFLDIVDAHQFHMSFHISYVMFIKLIHWSKLDNTHPKHLSKL